MTRQHNRFAAHYFTSQENLTFDPADYSRFKFGSSQLARQFGQELANRFFANHADLLLSNKVVVFASPYNYVQNAASMMTSHFVHRLNQLLVAANGEHVEVSVIHRHVTYVSDYGFLTKEGRRQLIGQDTFYLNKKFIRGKLLLFLDDIRITGTHEEKLIELIAAERLKNECMFLYFAELQGTNVTADIEATLNLYAIKSAASLVDMIESEGVQYQFIVRPIKFLLSRPASEFTNLIHRLPYTLREQLYNNCLGEGYYKVPAYQINFNQLTHSLSWNTSDLS